MTEVFGAQTLVGVREGRMRIKSTINGGIVEVDKEFGKQLISAGLFMPLDDKPVSKPSPSRGPRSKPAPQEPNKTDK